MLSNKCRGPLAAILGAGLATLAMLAGASAAQAAPVKSAAANRDTSVSVDRLVLDPTDRGYTGALAITVTYRGTEAGDLFVDFTEPVAGSFDRLDVFALCFAGQEQLRRTFQCDVGQFQPGERRTFSAFFHVYTTPRSFAMVATGGLVDAYRFDAGPAGGAVEFSTVFRSTTGSVQNPQPYVQDTLADASVTVGDAVLVRQLDGSFAGQAPVTVRYNGDAPHSELAVAVALPAGVSLLGTDPLSPCLGGGCTVPGESRFMPGEQRTFQLRLATPAGTAPGSLGAGDVQLEVRFGNTEIADVSPADNTGTFAISAAEAA